MSGAEPEEEDHELVRELFSRGWDVITPEGLLPMHGVDIAVVIHPESELNIQTLQGRWANNLAMRNGLMLVVSGLNLDLTECTRTNVSLVPRSVQTKQELAAYINGLPTQDGVAPAIAPPASPDTSVATILREMAATFEERNAVYGNNYLHVAPVMRALWPDGVPAGLVMEDRWHLFELVIVKLTRFARGNLTHIDSIHDAAVYAAMIESDIRRNG